MSNDTIATAPTAAADEAEASPALLVILVGGDGTLCIDDTCVTGEVGVLGPTAGEVIS